MNIHETERGGDSHLGNVSLYSGASLTWDWTYDDDHDFNKNN